MFRVIIYFCPIGLQVFYSRADPAAALIPIKIPPSEHCALNRRDSAAELLIDKLGAFVYIFTEQLRFYTASVGDRVHILLQLAVFVLVIRQWAELLHSMTFLRIDCVPEPDSYVFPTVDYN